MLIHFSVRNYKTFKEKATLNLVASNYDTTTRESENVFLADPFSLRLLKSAVVYGANASGKSKFIEALAFMRRFVLSSSKESQIGEIINVDPFRLSTETEKEASEFEIIFVHNNQQFRYGFEITEKEVCAEWLFYKPHTKQIELFYRDQQAFKVHRTFSRASLLVKEKLVRSNALLLSVLAQFNDEMAVSILEWFKNVRVISGLREDGYKAYTMSKTNQPSHKEQILGLLKKADLGIHDITIEELDVENLPSDFPRELRELMEQHLKEEGARLMSDVITTHRKYNEKNVPVEKIFFSMKDDESSGTSKFFALTGPVLNALENRHVLVIDELESKLHPNLVCQLVALFNSQKSNPYQAQLIFNTHDTNLLSSGLFRRDQIWFTEKDKYGAAKLYSLGDFKTDEVRKEENFEENYIRGKYGAVPVLGNFESLIQFESLENETKR